MIQHILLATDGSAPAERAADFAASLAKRYGAKLTVLHSYFFQFDKSLLGLMLLSAFILGVFLTYFFFICE